MKIEFEHHPPIELEITGLETLECKFEVPLNQMSIQEIDFQISLNNIYDDLRDLLFVVVGIVITDQATQDWLGNYRASCIFQAKGLDLKRIREKGISSVPEEVAAVWNGISVSTVRGMMFADLKGTFLHNAILPIVNPGLQKS